MPPRRSSGHASRTSPRTESARRIGSADLVSIFEPMWFNRRTVSALMGTNRGAALAKILIGTCSWTDKPLIESGAFYPKKSMTAEDRLRFYASNFPIVEVDSSYYALPSVDNSVKWAERTPEDFVIDIKAFRLFTGHWTERSVFPRDLEHELPALQGKKRGYYYGDIPQHIRDSLWMRFESAVVPLAKAGKLGQVLFQFPDYFYPSTKNLDHILEVKDKLRGFRLAVEFRSPAWTDDNHLDETLRFLRANNLTFVAVDIPQGLPSSVSAVTEATTDVGYIRFHGHNAATWKGKHTTSGERFDWYYQQEELEQWAPRIKTLAEGANEIHLLMNTNNYDQGPRNARLLAKVLQGQLSGIEKEEMLVGPAG
ncbi:MAG: DUF72 domain-containing protein [Dehalococcoidia bacterium]|nr:DUF72 domain-containing protein [Dehalococcoidia bacterium]